MRFAAIRAMTAAAMMALGLTACSNEIEVEPPARVETAPVIDTASSTMRVPLAISLDQLQSALQDRIPRRLWSIDEQRSNCIPAQRVRRLGLDIALTPDIACRILGEATRGRITLSGRGRDLLIRLPVNASLRAEDIGGILEGETATGSVMATLRARLSVTPDWRLRANIDVSYDWSEEPGIDFLGQRIRLTSHADRELQGLVTSLERELEREFARIQLHPFVDNAWEKGFAVISLNGENPPAWMRITPQALGVDGYHFEGRQMLVDIALAARTETVIGDRPPAPTPTALPPRAQNISRDGLHLAVPVLAQYAHLEPVLLRALRKLNEKGLSLPQVGAITADFRSVEIYATENGRIAVGVDAQVAPSEGIASRYGSAQGKVWLTGIPFNEPDSAVIAIRDLTIYGDSDRPAVDLLTRMVAGEELRAGIEQALVGDFTREYEGVIADAREALANLAAEGVQINASITSVGHGPIQVTGRGLFLPVAAVGTARLSASIN
ncbi:DUF4403 family protein [Alteraurantiacibacter aestuarii]|uniref:DUF4403 family protein n=1 Tax=Alteraurantiacibacter aestuarii TaxID=650004 RepID=A0A844ZJS9_9SPHN|nr:DUF4403 family protein [Alteraurantiacibacter aestuarii]MXO88711.1 DUF4403 family protein [Alteraurantiacibacter aestuarii]